MEAVLNGLFWLKIEDSWCLVEAPVLLLTGYLFIVCVLDKKRVDSFGATVVSWSFS